MVVSGDALLGDDEGARRVRGGVAALLLVASLVPAALVGADTLTVNRPPDAQAGPAPIVVDGGPDDADGSGDGTVDIVLDGSRTTDPDKSLENDITCEADSLIDSTHSEENITYSWYEGHDVDTSTADPIATGEEATILDREFGLHNFTLVTEDKCEETDTDIVRAMAVNDTHVTEQEWNFDNGTPAAFETSGFWRVTDECDIAGDGQYLAFNRPSVCDYDTSEPVAGNATFTYDLGAWHVVGLEFDTYWETRDTWVEEVQDHISVHASFDYGKSWTPADLTFDYTQGEYQANESWVKGAGVFDLQNSPYVTGNVSIRFSFDTNSSVDADRLGWLVDDVRLVGLDEGVYTASWGNKTFQEPADPVRRLETLDPEIDENGLPVLDPVSVPTPDQPSNASLENVTNAMIEDALPNLNLTDQDLKDAMNRTMGKDDNASDTLNETLDRIDAGLYVEAGNGILGDDLPYMEVTFWCGSDELREYTWVLAVPTLVDCDGDGEEATAVTLLPTWFDPYRSLVSDVTVSEMDGTFKSTDLGESTLRYTGGFGYDAYHFGAETSLEDWRIDVSLDKLEQRNKETTGSVEWAGGLNGALESFQEGDVLMHTQAMDDLDQAVLGDDLTFRWILSEPTSVVQTRDFEVVYEPFDWQVKAWVDEAIDLDFEAYLDMKNDRETHFRDDQSITNGFTLGHELYTSADDGRVNDFELQHPQGGDDHEFLNLEANLTYATSGEEVYTVEMQGASPGLNVFRMDPGEDGDGIPVIDISKVLDDNDGYHRTLMIDSHLPGFEMSSEASHVDRVQLFAGSDDPDLGDGEDYVSQAASAAVGDGEDGRINHVNAGVTLSGGQAYNGDLNSSRNRDNMNWRFHVDGDCPDGDSGCGGSIKEGSNATANGAGTNAHWWNVDANAGDLNIYKEANCRPNISEHECPW